MRTLRLVFPLALTLAGFAACGGGGGLVPSDAAVPGSGGALLGSGGVLLGSGGGLVASGGSGVGGGLGGGGGEAGGTGTGGAAPACPRHVHLLLQKSGAMFQSPTAEDNWWDAIAQALTGDGGLVDEFASQVELSVSVFSKNNAEDTDTCPLSAEVDAPVDPGDLADVLDAEKEDYEQRIGEAVKVDAPVVDAVEDATELLGADEGAYILLLVSDIPDSCATDDNQCTVEGVFSAVQAAHEVGIETRLVYLQSTGANIGGYPQGVANAGVGAGIADTNLNCSAGFEYSDAPGSAAYGAPENTGAIRQAIADILGDIAACD